jgi:putative hydrolase of the HAD superfamily
MKRYQNLLFDLDHTLWDFEKNSKVTLDELFTMYNLVQFFKDFDDFQDAYHRINSMLWSQYGRGKISKETVKYGRFSRCLENAGCKDKDLAKSIADEYVARSPCKTFLIPGAMATIQSLSGLYNMHIITNGFNEVQFKKINLSGLSPYFSNIFTSENAGFQKPDAGFFQFVFSHSNISRHNSLVIGDNLITDIGGAKEYGIDTVFFNPSDNKDYIGASFVISKIEELLSLL